MSANASPEPFPPAVAPDPHGGADPFAPDADDTAACLVAHVDYLGRIRGRRVPPERWPDAVRDGVTYNRANMNLTVADDLPPHPVLKVGGGDVVTVPVVETRRRLALADPLDIVFTRFTEPDGSPWDGCPRTLLERQVARLAAWGISARIGFEIEGYLFRTPDGPDRAKGFSDVSALIELEPFAATLTARAAEAGIPLLMFSKEMGPGQFEVNFPPRAPIQAAEDLATLRLLATTTARELGLNATFMPRLWQDAASSGLHVHLSLHEGGANLMSSTIANAAASEAALAGMLEHARALSFVSMPTVNSYRRLVAGSWTPVLASVGEESKDALIRYVGSGANRRFEFRAADGAASPYLLLTGLIASIAEGITAGRPPDPRLRSDDPPTADTVEQWRRDGRPVLPGTLLEAITAFEADTDMAAAFEPVAGSVLRQVKRIEWETLNHWVSPDERALYLRHY